MTTLPNMGLVLPTVGSDNGTWGTLLSAAHSLIDAHDHTSGKGLQVPSAGLKINADVPWAFGGTSYAITAIKALDFANVAGTSVSSLAGALFMADGTGGLVGNELYWRTTSGSNVRLTNGAALNVSAFTGGIGGDYSAVSAALNYDNSLTRYTFKGASGTNWARIASGEVRIFETGTSETVYVGLAAPAALGASYTVTWPTAAPTAGTRPVQMSTAGVLTAGDSDAVTVGGLLTASAGVTASSNQNVTLSGTGVVKHGTYTLSIPGAAFSLSAASTFYNGAQMGANSGLTTAFTAYAPIALPVGKRILAIRVFMFDSSTGPTKGQASFLSSAGSNTGAATTVASSSVSAGNSTAQTLSITGLTTTIAASTQYTIKYATTTGTDVNGVMMAEVDYDHP